MHLAVRREALNRPIIKAFIGDVTDVYQTDVPSQLTAEKKHSA